MRACLEALEDKVLPLLVADAEGEVAAAIKRYLLNSNGQGELRQRKAEVFGITKVPAKTHGWCGV